MIHSEPYMKILIVTRYNYDQTEKCYRKKLVLIRFYDQFFEQNSKKNYTSVVTSLGAMSAKLV
jgi:hypothetical protein